MLDRDSNDLSDWQSPRGRERIIEILQSNSFLAGLDCTAIGAIVDVCDIQKIQKGTIIFQQGDIGSDAVLLLSGAFTVSVSTRQGDTVLATIVPGGLVGEIGAFADIPRTATVRASEDSVALHVSRGAVEQIIAEYPAIAMTIIAGLGRRLERQNGAIASLTQAAHALAEGDFAPEMLSGLREEADRFSDFANAFEEMATEILRKKSLASEMQTAAEIQKSFLPNTMPMLPGHRFELAARMDPAADVGGDFYDYFALDEHRLALAVGDVSGKGIPASMFMSVARTVLKTVAREETDPCRIVERMNDLLSEDNSEGMFVTIAFAIVDLQKREVQIVGGGHEEIFVVSRQGDVAALPPTGPAIGFFGGATYDASTHKLSADQMIILATDGVTEAMNHARDQLGHDGTDRLLKKVAAKTAEQAVSEIFSGVVKFADGARQSDDITCLAFRLLD